MEFPNGGNMQLSEILIGYSFVENIVSWLVDIGK